ncbi:MAG: aminotransferase class V-fold PLP-dependent enzyme [Negativicutes bacterium]
MSDTLEQGQLFPDALQKQIRDQFCYIDRDPFIGSRLFFENAGGSFRLKKALAVHNQFESVPDCPERIHAMALRLVDVQNAGLSDVRIIFNATGGSILTSLTASQTMFEMTRAIAENVPGTNVVTTMMEHPSAYDAALMYAKRTGKEFRVAKANPRNGGVDVEEIVKLIDQDTCLLSVIYASNISGAVLDLKKIVSETRKIKPDLHIIVDAVQHAPHGVIDVDELQIDGINFAPYKCFGNRGIGFAWVSDRVAVLPHDKLLSKKASEWELGSPAPAVFAMVSEIVNYVCWIGGQFSDSQDRRTLYVEGMNRIKLHERALQYRMLHGGETATGLNNVEGVQVFFDQEDLSSRDLIMAIAIDGLDCTQAVREYEKQGVIVYERVASSLYSGRMLEACGLNGLIRVTPMHCNTIDEIDQFLVITQKIAQQFAAAS